MGVQGLLQLLKPAQRDCNLSQFRNQVAAIDVMTWLYKGAYSCAYELGLDQQTLSFLSYPIKMIKLVQSYGIKPLCVFDGLHLKAKEATEKMRSQNKKANKEMAMQNAENGNDDEARKYFMRSLVLRSKMIDLFIDILRCLDIDFVIAPYEADAQIAYMVREGIADFAISEDSDLIVYGCPKLLMKLNFNGYCKVFSWDDFKENKNISDKNLLIMQKFTREQFVQVCIMGGCEYLPSIQQVGLKVAVKQFEKFKEIDKVIEGMKTNKTFKERIPENYIEALKKVQQLFFYQTVYDSRVQKLVSLENKPDDLEVDEEFLGPKIADDILDDFVNGYLSKSTFKKREVYGQVVDFKRLLIDYKANSINERSFVCLDKSFFRSGFSQCIKQDPNHQSRASEEMKSQPGLIPAKVAVETEDLGFCFDDDDDEDENSEEQKLEEEDGPIQASLNKDNKQIKEDLEFLSSLCSDIIKEPQYIDMSVEKHSQKQQIDQSSSIVSTPKSNKNKFLKLTDEKESHSKEENPFKKFDDLKVILEEDPEKENAFKVKNKNILASSNKKVEKPKESKKRARNQISNTISISAKKVDGKLDSYFEKSGNKRLRVSEGGKK